MTITVSDLNKYRYRWAVNLELVEFLSPFVSMASDSGDVIYQDSMPPLKASPGSGRYLVIEQINAMSDGDNLLYFFDHSGLVTPMIGPIPLKAGLPFKLMFNPALRMGENKPLYGEQDLLYETEKITIQIQGATI